MILNRMLGVPYGGTGKQRWIDNHGETNANNCRFGGENGGMTVAINYNSFVCYPCDSYTAGCGPCWSTPPHDIAPYNRTMSGAGPTFAGGGMRFNQCDMFSKASSFGRAGMGGAVFYLEEIPSYFVLKDCMGFVECTVCGLPGESLIKINPSIELSSEGQLAVAARYPNSLHFDIPPGSNSWIPSRGGWEGASNSSSGYASLPLELLPYSANPVLVDGPPTAGYWRVGQRVWSSNVTATGTEGWVCVGIGEPGLWRPISPGAIGAAVVG
jgi:hypothetical protein